MSADNRTTYISTRGSAPPASFKQAIIAGLAEDGGLYIPETWPTLTQSELEGFYGQPYSEVSATVIDEFTGGEIEREILQTMTREAYSGFNHRAVAPLYQLSPNEWLLELFHGPTLAFKDVAMQLLGRLVDHVLAESGRRMTIVGATSGDTGGAAMHAFGGKQSIDVFFLFPHRRISEFQQRQMTTLPHDNTHAIAIEGSFDDCQAIVKAMLADSGFRADMALGTVNSINWGRIIAQIVYFITACVSLGLPRGGVSFSVPTGNFGDIYAGYVAKRMGAPVNRLIIACNENDILARLRDTGAYEPRKLADTITPSMDIQVASNFERLLFDLADRDPSRVSQLMSQFKETNAIILDDIAKARLDAEFDAGVASQTSTLASIRKAWQESTIMIDPHTAVGVEVAGLHRNPTCPMVILATAHPAKFAETIKSAIHVEPPVPPWTQIDRQSTERLTVLPNSVDAVRAHVAGRKRS